MLEVVFGVAAILAWPVGLMWIRRLWRAGRISTRAATASGLMLLPTLVTAVFLVQTRDLVFTLFVGGVTFGLPAAMYGTVLGLMEGVRDVPGDTTDPLVGMPCAARVAILVMIAIPQLLLVAVFVALAVSPRI